MIFENLINIIRNAQDRHPTFSIRLAEAEALGRWPIAVGEVIAKHARAIRVKDSILWVEVEHPIWRSELHYRKQQILDILNAKAPCPRQDLAQPKDVLVDIFYIDPNPKRSRFSS
jgi:predicted nucleic acid-binding Zn ribbon protein